ncbi:MAG: copper chaperone PCu(A)C [Pseudomonadota bacterium]|nr:copper chaperone PCu(A)C [Pseudomonadota bacterium]
MRLSLILATTLAAVSLALGGCQPKMFYIDKGYVQLPAVPGRPAVAYFTLHGGATDTTLMSVRSDVAIRAEMHESMNTGGMSSMKPLASVDLPAGGAVRFRPGGKHVMLYDISPRMVPGRTMPLVFTFTDGGTYAYAAPVIAAGAPTPKE